MPGRVSIKLSLTAKGLSLIILCNYKIGLHQFRIDLCLLSSSLTFYLENMYINNTQTLLFNKSVTALY